MGHSELLPFFFAMAYAIVLGILFTVWLVVTIGYQVPTSWTQRLKIYDYSSLISNWRFFAPRPIFFDYKMVYRDQLGDGTILPWQEVQMPKGKLNRVVLWHPEKRWRKAFFNIMRGMSLQRHLFKDLPAALQLTSNYLYLLNIAMGCPHAQGTQKLQFAVLISYGYITERPPKLIMHSKFHELE
ncbi:MAG TPA: hypothetical protein DCE41_18925 [Cytophagales bacterium]|nr:hypothetical protein [Cytophagales bacterium]HAA22116.1 hypothetical protein [Cytophagales bacterium]HAP60828.1 hypothetical protein [Cytophagales bacterium]